MENNHCPQEHRDNFRVCRTALYSTPTSNVFRVNNPLSQHNFLSVGEPIYTTQLVASHRSGQEEDCSKDGYGVPLLNRKIDLSARNGVLIYKQTHLPLMYYACPAWRSAA